MTLNKIAYYLLILTTVNILDQVSSQGCRTCAVPVYQRRICQGVSPSATVKECEDAGCCYDRANYFSLFYRTIKCYQQRITVCPSFTCDVRPRDRERCGTGTIDFPISCRLAGCCFDEASSPSCYRIQPFNRSLNTFIDLTSTIPPTTLRATTPRIPGIWSRWGPWTPCSQTCTRGIRTRTRICIFRAREVSLTFCIGEASDEQDCNTELCQTWGNWTEYGICSARCNRFGTIRATRTCEDLGSPGPSQCQFGIRSCGTDVCRPRWASWLPWSRCSSAACGPGTRLRYRQCAFNGVSVNPQQCRNIQRDLESQQDPTVNVGVCDTFMCNTWTTWTAFGKCTCNQGNVIAARQSTRSCFDDRPSPSTERERNAFDTCGIRWIRCRPEECENEQPIATSTDSIPVVTSTTAPSFTTPSIGRRRLSTVNSTPATVDVSSMSSTTELKTTTQATAAAIATTTTTAIATPQQPDVTTTSTAAIIPEIPSTTIATTSQTTLPVTMELITERPTSPTNVETRWGQWSTCSQSCGPGSQMRILNCVTRDGTVVENSPECKSQESVERRACNLNYCSQWTEWEGGDCVANCNYPTVGFGIRQSSRSCINGTQDAAPSECSVEASLCLAPDYCSTSSTQAAQTTSSPVSTTTPVAPSTQTVALSSSVASTAASTTLFISQISWNEWEEWGKCSEECEVGLRVRSRTCMAESSCEGASTQTEYCNINICNNWSSWSTTCTERCGGGIISEERRCINNMETGRQKCFRRDTAEECNTQSCDRNLDILFLLDSSDYVDNCRKLRRENYTVPISPQLVNEEVTPVYAKMKEFVTQFMEDWRYAESQKTRIGIQLISKACSARTKQNLNVLKHFDESHENFAAQYIDLLPYECGSFFLDLALTCAEENIFVPPRGDRESVPNVVVALVSRVPSYIQPSDFLLSAISRRFNQAGITTISAGVTPLSRLSRASSRKRYEDMLKAVSCQGKTNCPTYIGSIWDENQGRPAERIRNALSSSDTT